MASGTIAIDIARPPAEVFDFMMDMSKMTVWTNMQRMELDGPLTAGTTGSFDLPMMGRRRIFPFVITAYEPGRRWAIRVTNRVGMAFEYRVEPTASGARVVQAIEVSPRGLFLRLLAGALLRMVKAEEMGELRRLKAAVEQPDRRGATAGKGGFGPRPTASSRSA